MTTLRAELLLVLVTALWSGTFVLVKSALEWISPSGFVVARFALASLFGLLLWGRSLRLLNRQLAKDGLVLGFLFGIGFVLQSIGLSETTATSSAFITGTTVVFVPFVYLIVRKQSVTLLNLISTVAVLLGLYVFIEPERFGFLLGDGLTLLSAIGWAGYIVALDEVTSKPGVTDEHRNLLVLLQFLVTTAVAGMFVLLLERDQITVNVTTPLIAALLYCGLFATVITTWLQTRVQRHTHPVRAGVIFSMEPLFASVVALGTGYEVWTWRQGAGACILLTAVIVPDILTLWRRNRDES